MKKVMKALISLILVASMLMSAVVVAYAASDETYLSEVRLVYANTYEEAKQVLDDSKLEGFQILNENLNANSGKTGVWLAYKTTTNVDDAITDIAVMQMGGGYNAGNYQEMIKKSREEYLAMGEIYLQAIEYFMGAYDAGNFLADSAYRQLNFYSGMDKHQNQKLGDVFVGASLTASELATLFMEGNVYVLGNIRSLLAMGVSYNEDGLHYLEKVDAAVKELADDPTLYEEEDYDALAMMIASAIPVFRSMFEELSAYEDELNYDDDDFTDLEIRYAEYKAMADMMRAVTYLDGKTLYDFCMDYAMDTEDYTSLYPMVAALNDGQIALTTVGHFYDVVRYSINEYPEETIDAEIAKLEEEYGADPFDVYTGVDRSIFDGTFALTNKALRQDAYTDGKSFAETLFGNGAWKATALQIGAGAVGIGLFVWAIVRTARKTPGAGIAPITTEHAIRLSGAAQQILNDRAAQAGEALGNTLIMGTNIMGPNGATYIEVLDDMFTEVVNRGIVDGMQIANWDASTTFTEKLEILYRAVEDSDIDPSDDIVSNLQIMYDDFHTETVTKVLRSADEQAQAAFQAALATWGSRILTGLIYIAGAVSLAYSVMSLYSKYYEHYHPDYDDVPVSMVDLVRTSEGDRYIKYDVVYEAMQQQDKGYAPGDLNAFQGQRWNALYYTKSYEAGKPLLAEFVLSNVSNRPDEGHLAVHRFGEVVCYDLNKYNFSSDSANIFLSIEQSENQKSAVADVPQVVGTILGNGIWFLAGGIGLIAGIGATVGTQAILKDKKKGSKSDADGDA